MPYPSSCGQNGAITDISLACLNDLLSNSNNDIKCNTTFQATGTPNVFTLVGSTPNLLPFSTYGQTLERVSANMSLLPNNYPLFCQKGTYINPRTATANERLDSYNTELNGLNAQYKYLYDQYYYLSRSPPANVTSTAAALSAASTAYTATPTVDNSNSLVLAETAARSASSAYYSTLDRIKADIDKIYQQILSIAGIIKTEYGQNVDIENSNNSRIELNAANLLSKITSMQSAFTDLNAANLANDPTLLDGTYEEEELKTTSKFMRNILYILFAFFVIGCLVMIHFKPTEGKLDMFIMALGVIILVYYVYNYFQTG